MPSSMPLSRSTTPHATAPSTLLTTCLRVSSIFPMSPPARSACNHDARRKRATRDAAATRDRNGLPAHGTLFSPATRLRVACEEGLLLARLDVPRMDRAQLLDGVQRVHAAVDEVRGEHRAGAAEATLAVVDGHATARDLGL